MLKSKIVKLLNNCKELVMRRKKEVALSAAGVVLLGGIGFGTYYMTRDNANDVASSSPVVEEEIVETSGDTSETVEDENASTEVGSETTETTENTENNGAVAQGEVKDENTSSNEENKGGSSVGESTSNTDNKPSNTGNTSGNSGSSSQGSTSTSKPENKPVSKPENKPVNKPVNKPSTPNNGGSSKPSHTHNWVAQTKQVHHKEQGHYENVLVKPAWTEEVPIYEERERSICNGCGADITGNTTAHNKNHVMNGEKGGWHSEWKKVQVGTKKVHHDAVYKKKWVVDKKAWTETVVVGHKCSGCGQTK